MSAPTAHETGPFTVIMKSRGGETVHVKDRQTQETVKLGDEVIMKARRLAADPKRRSREDERKWWKFW